MARKRKGEGIGQTGEGQDEESPESRRQGKTQRKKKERNTMMTWTDFDLTTLHVLIPFSLALPVRRRL